MLWWQPKMESRLQLQFLASEFPFSHFLSQTKVKVRTPIFLTELDPLLYMSYHLKFEPSLYCKWLINQFSFLPFFSLLFLVQLFCRSEVPSKTKIPEHINLDFRLSFLDPPSQDLSPNGCKFLQNVQLTLWHTFN